MKMLFLTPNVIDTCSFYRSGGVAPDLRKRMNIEIDVRSWDMVALHWQSLLDYNLIMMQRPFNSQSLQLGLYIKDLGIPLWVDYDDLLLDLPEENTLLLKITEPVKEIIKNVISIADVVSVTTTRLKEELSPFSKNIEVIPNAFNDYIFHKREPLKPREKIVAWRGSESHIADLLNAALFINELMKIHHDWGFLFMGYNPWFITKGENFRHVPVADPMVYFKHFLAVAPAVMHVPLNDSVFNRCKSNIAYIEAAYFGAACLAPGWEEWSKPGCLNYVSLIEYAQLLELAIEDQGECRKLSKLAWDYVSDNLMLSKINNQRENLIKNLMYP
jgi:hypothetical protein